MNPAFGGGPNPTMARYMPLLQKNVGSNHQPLPQGYYNYDAGDTSDEQVWRDLWAVWYGLSIQSFKVFQHSLKTMDDEIVNLFPTKDSKEALQDPRIHKDGNKYTFNKMRSNASVLAIGSKRMPGPLIQSYETSYTRHDTMHVGGFDIDMDFLKDDNKKLIWLNRLDTLNDSIRLTWVYKTLKAILNEGLDNMDKRLSESMPYTHQQFVIQSDGKHDSMFAMVKNGTSWAGLENRLLKDFVNQGLLKDIRIILGYGSLIMNRYDDRTRESFRSGFNAEEMTTKNLEDASVVNRSPLKGESGTSSLETLSCGAMIDLLTYCLI